MLFCIINNTWNATTKQLLGGSWMAAGESQLQRPGAQVEDAPRQRGHLDAIVDAMPDDPDRAEPVAQNGDPIARPRVDFR